MSLYDYTKIDPCVESLLSKEVLSDSITQNWTRQALDCYQKNCDCTKCTISKYNYSFVCQMSKIVKMLLKLHGKPKSSDYYFAG